MGDEDKTKAQLIEELGRLRQRVTELEAAEAGWVQAEQEIKSLAKFPSENPNPVLRIDRQGLLLYANEAAFSQLSDWDLGVGQAVPEVLLGLVQEAEEAHVKTVDIPCGERIYSVAAAYSPESGYINAYARDITERKKASRALRRSEKFLQDVFDAIQDGISVLDIEFNVIRTNRWMEERHADRMPLAGQKY